MTIRFHCVKCGDLVYPDSLISTKGTYEVYCMACGHKHTINLTSSGCQTCTHNEYDHSNGGGYECEVMDCECRKFEKNV